MHINPGDLKRRITLQQRSTTQDAMGGQVTTWSDLLTVWASIEPLSGRALVNAQAVATEVSHKITLRWQSALADPKVVSALRISYKGRFFNIAAALNENENNNVLILLASEGLNDG